MEEWRQIGDTPYWVSSYGNVATQDRYVAGKGLRKGQLIRACPTSCGYLQITMWISGKASYVSIHRAVAEAFIKNPENLPQVNHLDLNKHNNNVSNLEWATGIANVEHFRRSFKEQTGVSAGTLGAKLTPEAVKEVKAMLALDISCLEISRHFNVTRQCISLVKNGKTWTD